MREFVKCGAPRADIGPMSDDPFASLSPGVFGSHPPASENHLPPHPDVRVGDIQFSGLPRNGTHTCDDRGRVPVGAGYYAGENELDLCPSCFEPLREHPQVAPTPEEQVRFARSGIGTGGGPRIVTLQSEAELTALVDVLDASDVRRILVRTSMALPNDPRIHPTTPKHPARSESGPLRSFELQLQGLSFGPPLDPALVAELEAAKDEHGVIRDAALGDRYFEALVAQNAEMDELMGRPEPVIEQGPVFPSFADDEEPLPG